MNLLGIIASLLAACCIIISAIVTATWHLSTKIGDLRLEATKNDGKINEMWGWFVDVRRPSQERALAHRAGQLT
jgi:hypothetical protein